MTIKRGMILVAIAVVFAITTLLTAGGRGEARTRMEVLDRSGNVVGWAYEAELTPTMPDPDEVKSNFDVGQRVEVHGSNGQVVGYIVRGTGFVPRDQLPR